jgi:hypothetical protein
MPTPSILTIPALPAEDFEAAATFWQALGFTETYRQKAPYAYAVLRHGDGYEIHFYGLKPLPPENNFSTCLVIVPDVESRHADFLQRTKTLLGRNPDKGFPRLSRFKAGQTRFTVTDTAGNSVIFVKNSSEDEEKAQKYKEAGLTPLQRALALAERMRDYKNDDALALRTIENALRHFKPKKESPEDHARALALRTELREALKP